MSEHDTTQQPPEDEPEPAPQPEPEPAPRPEQTTPPEPRRLLRSRDDRVIGGVAGGLGRYFNVDPVFFRVGFVALVFLGGLGVFLYLAALLFVPSGDSAGGEPPSRGRALTIVGAAILVCLGGVILADEGWWFGGPLGFVLVLGAAVWWLVWGRPRARDANARSTLTRLAIVLLVLFGSALLLGASIWAAAAGGGVAVALLVIAIGVLIALAAFRGGARWLIVPAFAIAAGVGLVAAADVDLEGGYGKRVFAPASLAELPGSYELGAGRLEVDLRGLDFTAGERRLALEVGFGEAVLVVPREVCVVADADVGAGYLRVLDWDNGGFNVEWDEAGTAADVKLRVAAHVGMGALKVVHDPREAEWEETRRHGPGGWDESDEDDAPALGRSAACRA